MPSDNEMAKRGAREKGEKNENKRVPHTSYPLGLIRTKNGFHKRSSSPGFEPGIF